MKSKFTLPEIKILKQELELTDISTNAFIQTITHTIPLKAKNNHPTLGLITSPHPDMKNAMELRYLQHGTQAQIRYLK